MKLREKPHVCKPDVLCHPHKVLFLLQYAQSKTCRMEFQFAVASVRIPVICAVVGTGYKWESSEVSFLSSSLFLLLQLGEGCCCWLVALRPSNRLVYLRDGSAQTILRAATLR